MEGLFLIILLLVFYFLPTFIAGSRSHHNGMAIFLLNLLLGWTFLGWVLALIWSATAVQQKPTSQGEPTTPNQPEQPVPAEPPEASEAETEEVGGLTWDALPLELKWGGAGFAVIAVLIVGFLLAGETGSSGGDRGTASAEALQAVARREACIAAVGEARFAFDRADRENWEFFGITEVESSDGEAEVVGCVPTFNTGSAGGAVNDAVVIARLEPQTSNWTTAYLVEVRSVEGDVLAEGLSAEVLAELQGEEAAADAASAEARIAEREQRQREAAERIRQASIGRQWRSSSSQSQMMDFTNHFLSVGPEAPIRDQFGRQLNVRLTVRCLEDTTAIYVDADEYLGLDDTLVEWRVDRQRAFQRRVNISTNNEAFGYWRGNQSIPFIRPLLDAEYLTVRYTPYGDNARTARFHVEGLGNRITTLRRACSW